MSATPVFSPWQKFYEPLFELADETTTKLGDNKAGRFVNIANDWMDIQFALMDTVPEDELLHSVTYLHFQGLFKEIYWLQLFLLGCNYPLVLARLRFAWEWIFQGYFADRELACANGRRGCSIEDKIGWLERKERDLGWPAIRPALRRLIPADKQKAYHAIWLVLIQNVHPSVALVDRMIDPSSLLVRNALDKKWAMETIATATRVFDLVWFIVLRQFPACIKGLAEKQLCVEYVLTDKLLTTP